MKYTTLVDAATLAAHRTDLAWRVVDCRFELSAPEAGAAAYAAGHIDGAVYAHLDRDLAAPRSASSGRHPLPEPATLAATFGRLGIGDGTQVVAYDDSGGMYAARLWWLLRWLGHDAVAVLDGGLAAWRAAGGALVAQPSRLTPARFTARLRPRTQADADEVAALTASGAGALLDARSAERFEGRVEPLDARAGHVPGARNHPYARNLGADGRFLPPQELRTRLTAALAGSAPAAAVSMCGSGVTACHTLLAMEIAELTGARLYPGSWSEWSRDPARPGATGP